MATNGKSTDKGRKRKNHYLPQNKPVKKKGSYPLRPGFEGFFITCDGGREHQASNEALNVIDTFFEELVHGKDAGAKLTGLPLKPSNKKIIFSDSTDDDDDNDEEIKEEEAGEDEKEGNKPEATKDEKVTSDKGVDSKLDDTSLEKQTEENVNGTKEDGEVPEDQANEADNPPAKKLCLEADASERKPADKVEEKSMDKLIEDELKELGDKNKRRFANLDCGCNGVVIIQMRNRVGDPTPKDVAQHMMTSTAATKKHLSRFILRLLPVEVTCYASEDEISRAIKPLVERYFPVETESPQKFAVLYEARANTGIDRMKIINAVAKSVPEPHKVDLSNPDMTIVVQIVKTVCLIGVVEKYKELSKYNLRQLTMPK